MWIKDVDLIDFRRLMTWRFLVSKNSIPTLSSLGAVYLDETRSVPPKPAMSWFYPDGQAGGLERRKSEPHAQPIHC